MKILQDVLLETIKEVLELVICDTSSRTEIHKPWEGKYNLFKFWYGLIADNELVKIIPVLLAEFDQAEARICKRWDVNTEKENIFERELQISSIRKELALDETARRLHLRKEERHNIIR